MAGLKFCVKTKLENNKIVCDIPDGMFEVKIREIIKLCEEKCGGYVSVEMRRPYKPKTVKENSKYWAMCNEFGLFMGMTKEEVSDGIKERAVAERGYPTEENPLSKKIIPLSIRKATTVQQSILIDELYFVASENGYVFDEDKISDKAKDFDNKDFKESKNFSYEDDQKIQDDFLSMEIF